MKKGHEVERGREERTSWGQYDKNIFYEISNN